MGINEVACKPRIKLTTYGDKILWTQYSVLIDYLVDHYLLLIAMYACIFILFIYFIL